MSDTVTSPTTPAEWARALDAMTADQVARHVSSPPDLHSARWPEDTEPPAWWRRRTPVGMIAARSLSEGG
jgi:hypothetical protein